MSVHKKLHLSVECLESRGGGAAHFKYHPWVRCDCTALGTCVNGSEFLELLIEKRLELDVLSSWIVYSSTQL